MGNQRQEPAAAETPVAPEPEPEVVAAAAARLLVEAARGAAAPATHGTATGAPAASTLRDDPTIAEIHEEIASVQSELSEVNSGVIGLQTHGLRQTGVAALVLAVLIAIAWKVIAG